MSFGHLVAAWCTVGCMYEVRVADLRCLSTRRNPDAGVLSLTSGLTGPVYNKHITLPLFLGCLARRY